MTAAVPTMRPTHQQTHPSDRRHIFHAIRKFRFPSSHVLLECNNKSDNKVTRVPEGTFPGDVIRFVDMNNNACKMAKSTMVIPKNASTGTSMLCPEGVHKSNRLVLLDGNGVQVGGGMLFQHAVRLKIHCRFCNNREHCDVMGCHPKDAQIRNLCDRNLVGNEHMVGVYESFWLKKNRRRCTGISRKNMNTPSGGVADVICV